MPPKKIKKATSQKNIKPPKVDCAEKRDTHHVYVEGSEIYSCMLNQTNIKNNNNKYYMLQLYERNGGGNYCVWYRWGRVGYAGQHSLFSFGNVDDAKKEFIKKFSDKTKNDWENRSKFVTVAGKYTPVFVDDEHDEVEESSGSSDVVDAPAAKKVKKLNVPESKLPNSVQGLLRTLFDMSAMAKELESLDYDIKKAPLGRLTTQQIKKGYTILNKINNILKKPGYSSTSLTAACNEFYTTIPHSFGMKAPPLINTKEQVKAKLELLDTLSDVHAAVNMMKKQADDDMENPLDIQYRRLGCSISQMPVGDEMYTIIEEFLRNTHGPTHNHYTMEVEDIFVLNKSNEEKSFIDFGNRALLWHGSRVSNFAGILLQSLRIAPPEAPVTGYMFGKGIYFADSSSKSANYCHASHSSPVQYLLLCDVSLGKVKELLEACYEGPKVASKEKMNSVQGMGKLAPDPKENFVMNGGVVVPRGKLIETGLQNPKGYTLQYNEYIVYDPRQVRMRYLVKVHFKFNSSLW